MNALIPDSSNASGEQREVIIPGGVTDTGHEKVKGRYSFTLSFHFTEVAREVTKDQSVLEHSLLYLAAPLLLCMWTPFHQMGRCSW